MPWQLDKSSSSSDNCSALQLHWQEGYDFALHDTLPVNGLQRYTTLSYLHTIPTVNDGATRATRAES